MIDIKLNKNWLQQRVNINGENNAVISSSRNITYRQLSDKVNECAEYLSEHNINREDRVGLLFSNSIDFIICILSLWKLGAVPFPLNLRLSGVELEKQIQFAEIKLLIVEEGLSSSNNDIKFHNKVYLSPKFEVSSNISLPSETTNDDSTALILFTSGSTDNPKAVELTFSNLFYSAKSIDDEINFSRNDVFLATLPFYHIGGFSIIIRALLSGGSLALTNSIKTDDIFSGIMSFNPSIISLVPTQLKRFVDANEKSNIDLRCVFLGGGPIDELIIKKALELCWKLYIVYGSTETSSMVTMLKPSEMLGRLNCAGKPISGNSILIKDEKGFILKPNAEGRVHIISKSVMKGYLNLKEQSPKENEFISDDMGFTDHKGYLYITGRYDDIIVSGGENINCRQVDKELQSHPNILDSFSFGVKDSEWGQKLCSVIILQSEVEYSEKELRNFLKSKLADYKIPKKIFTVDKLPKSDLGKVEKNKLLNYLYITSD
jgi:O-succinylbenzoic acid--CoA ligase